MFKIVSKKVWSALPGEQPVKQFDVEAPLIAEKHQAGQFIILRVNETGERIPLTIADKDTEKGLITLVFQEVGKTTKLLGMLNEGDFILDITGPLGKPTHIEKFGTVVCVGGGIGIAPLHPIAQSMKKAGNHVISILGARTKELLVMEEHMRAASNEVLVATDDGSYGTKGFVTQILQELIDKGTQIDLVVAIGPPIMMKMVCKVTEPYGIHTYASLNTIMIDGTGMCGGCRVSVGGESKFVCVDGPEFDGHKVNWDEMMERQRQYIHEEKVSDETLEKHDCRLDSQVK